MKRPTKIPVPFGFSISSSLVAVIYFIIGIALSVYLRANTASTDGFFAELGNVSAALASGEGFSNVFDSNSGPTAWCPPLHVICYAVAFEVFGVRTEAAFWALITFRCLLLSLALFYMLEINYSHRLNKYKALLLPIFLVYTSLVVYRTGPKDVMFAVFFSVLLLYTMQRIWYSSIAQNRLSVVILAILLPLTNISLSIALMIFLAIYIFAPKDLRERKGRAIEIILPIGLMFMVIMGWGLRNQVAMNKFIPFKSNLWFELYISNVVDDDGILKYSNYEKFHPYNNSTVANKYKELGEIEFLNQYKTKAIDYFAKSFPDFLSKILNRSFNIFVFAESEKDIELAAIDSFSSTDVLLLEKHNLIVDQYWVCLEYSEDQFEKVLNQINTSNPSLIKQDWSAKVVLSSSRVNNTQDIKELSKSLLTSILPSLAIIIALFIFELRKNPVFLATIALYILGIGPYLVISWTPRYQSFQIGLFSILLFMLLAWLTDLFLTSRGLSMKIRSKVGRQ